MTLFGYLMEAIPMSTYTQPNFVLLGSLGAGFYNVSRTGDGGSSENSPKKLIVKMWLLV